MRKIKEIINIFKDRKNHWKVYFSLNAIVVGSCLYVMVKVLVDIFTDKPVHEGSLILLFLSPMVFVYTVNEMFRMCERPQEEENDNEIEEQIDYIYRAVNDVSDEVTDVYNLVSELQVGVEDNTNKYVDRLRDMIKNLHVNASFTKRCSHIIHPYTGAEHLNDNGTYDVEYYCVTCGEKLTVAGLYDKVPLPFKVIMKNRKIVANISHVNKVGEVQVGKMTYSVPRVKTLIEADLGGKYKVTDITTEIDTP